MGKKGGIKAKWAALQEKFRQSIPEPVETILTDTPDHEQSDDDGQNYQLILEAAKTGWRRQPPFH